MYAHRYVTALWKLIHVMRPQRLTFAWVFPPERCCRSLVVAILIPQFWATLLFKTICRNTRVVSQFNHLGFFRELRLLCRPLAAILIISSCKSHIGNWTAARRQQSLSHRCALAWMQKSLGFCLPQALRGFLTETWNAFHSHRVLLVPSLDWTTWRVSYVFILSFLSVQVGVQCMHSHGYMCIHKCTRVHT